MNIKFLNILWINDYTIKEVPYGGAELTDYSLLEAAKEKSLDIDFAYSKQVSLEKLKKYDLVILSNNYDLPYDIRQHIIQRKKYITLSHDIGRWGEILRDNKQLFNNAKLAIFASPGHKLKLDKYTLKSNTVCIPPYISESFYDYEQERNGKYMFVGYLHEAKGIWNVIEFAQQHPLKYVDFYSYGNNYTLKMAIKNVDNCTLKEAVPRKDIPALYNKYSYLISLPVVYESFSRVVVEAYFCGCKLLINNKIGAFSYKYSKEKLRKITLISQNKFWGAIKKAINA